MNPQQQQSIFDQWLYQHKALLFKIIRVYAFTPMDRDDLFQEMTIQVWRSIPSFRDESMVSTWIYRIGLNTAIKWIRKEKHHRHAVKTPDEMEPLLTDAGTAIDERLAWLYEQIAQLDPVDRSVILLSLDGFSYKEMAVILGISETNVGVKISRIKKKLVNQSKTTSNGI